MPSTTIPARYRNTVIPHIMIRGAAAAIDFYREALGAVELFRIAHPNGRIVHAEISIAGSTVMLGDADGPFADPLAAGGPSVALHVYVDDADALFARAIAAGARELQPMRDMFYGDRMGIVEDPFATSGSC